MMKMVNGSVAVTFGNTQKLNRKDDVMKFIEEYKGYKIYKCDQDDYMKSLNLHFMAYDKEENLFDGATTLEQMKERIDVEG